MPQRSLWKGNLSIFLARNKARVLFGQAIDSITEPNKIIPLVLSIHLSQHTPGWDGGLGTFAESMPSVPPKGRSWADPAPKHKG
uniref:Uncharacterized protein n=1 Tax=Lactuca sativa TaxID=4236 RepID=A0A9R1VDB4_LACSA|nr:hypothetical protein LSAT_V11C500281570 [Lactuca sativa]